MKNRWKHIFIPVPAMALCLSLAACGNSDDVAGDDWRTTGVVVGSGTIAHDGESVDVLVTVCESSAAFYRDLPEQVLFDSVSFPMNIPDAEQSFNAISFDDMDGDGESDVLVSFIHENGDATELLFNDTLPLESVTHDSGTAVFDVGIPCRNIRFHSTLFQRFVCADYRPHIVEAEAKACRQRGFKLKGTDGFRNPEECGRRPVSGKAYRVTYRTRPDDRPYKINPLAKSPYAERLAKISISIIHGDERLTLLGDIENTAKTGSRVHNETPDFNPGFPETSLQHAVQKTDRHLDIVKSIAEPGPHRRRGNIGIPRVDGLNDLQQEDVIEAEPEPVPPFQGVGNGLRFFIVVILEGRIGIRHASRSNRRRRFNRLHIRRVDGLIAMLCRASHQGQHNGGTQTHLPDWEKTLLSSHEIVR